MAWKVPETGLETDRLLIETKTVQKLVDAVRAIALPEGNADEIPIRLGNVQYYIDNYWYELQRLISYRGCRFLFQYATDVKDFGDLMSHVELAPDLYEMFRSCTQLVHAPTLKTSKVTSMQSMYYGCARLVSAPAYNTSKCTDFSYMYANCVALTDVGTLDLSKATTVKNMFENCPKLKNIDLRNIGISIRIAGSPSTAYGSSLTYPCLVNLANELRGTGNTLYVSAHLKNLKFKRIFVNVDSEGNAVFNTFTAPGNQPEGTISLHQFIENKGWTIST
jgi:hypothetical protein